MSGAKALKWLDLAAVILIAAFIWWPLIIAPYKPAQPIHSISKTSVYQNEWQRIIAGTHATDWILCFVGLGQLLLLGVQAGIYSGQRDLMERQLTLSIEQYVASHRPRLRARNFYVNTDTADRQTGAFTGQFTLVNVGGGVATILEGVLLVDWRVGNLPMKRPYDGWNPTLDYPLGRFVAGDRRAILFGSGHVRQDPSVADFGSTNSKQSVMGYVEYSDAVGRRYRTAFCRTFDRISERFTISKNEDYEHEE